MNSQPPPGQAFSNRESAEQFDKKHEKLAAIKDALHLLMISAMADIADVARILCVGAGTGAELLAMAKARPNWQFTVVEPAAAMLDVCRAKTKAAQIESRCLFIQDYVENVPLDERYDAATSILVSQFILQREQRMAYFSHIAQLLKPDALFISADLSGDATQSSYQPQINNWLAMNRLADIAFDPSVFEHRVALTPEAEILDLLRNAGFSQPIRFFQAFFIYAWISRLEPTYIAR